MYRPQHRDKIYIAKANEVSPADVVIPADRKLSQAFKPRARLLQLLGDQLIGSSKLAVFELVKIAYDADASKVEVKLGDLGTASPWIRVEDNGQGMSLETIRDVWLVPGDDHCEKDRHQDRRSPKYNRLHWGRNPRRSRQRPPGQPLGRAHAVDRRGVRIPLTIRPGSRSVLQPRSAGPREGCWMGNATLLVPMLIPTSINCP